jgi:hypothetical protein
MRASILIPALLAGAIFASPAHAYDAYCEPDFATYSKHVVHIALEHNGRYIGATAVWLRENALITLDTSFRAVVRTAVGKEVIIRTANVPYESDISLYEKQQRDATSIRATVRRFDVIDSGVSDSLVAIVLDRDIEGVAPVSLHNDKPLRLGDPIFTVLYSDGIERSYWPQLRYGSGHIFKPNDEANDGGDRSLDSRLLYGEMVRAPELKRRDVAGDGSAGAPVFSCAGALVGLVSKGLTQKTSIGILPTAWGRPNVVGVKFSMMSAVLLDRIK